MMRDLSLTAPPVRLAGIHDVQPTASGVRIGRLPAWTRAQYSDPMTRAVVSMPSGCRAELATDSSVVEVDLLHTQLVMGERPPYPAVVDLVVDGAVVASRTLDGGNRIAVDATDPTRITIERGAPSSVVFDGLGSSPKQLEVWLPHNAMVELRALRVDDGADVAASIGGRRRWLHYGSSISHCMEADRPTSVWPAIAARLADVDLVSFGLGGSCHLDQFVARAIRDLPVDVISLKVGINVVNGDTLRERTFGPALHGFLDTVRDGHPDTPILLVSPIVCPAVENHPGPTQAGSDGVFGAVSRPLEAWIGSLTLTRIREIESAIVASRRDAGDGNLHYLDGLELFGPSDVGDLPDGLHPNTAGYARMGQRFYDRALAPGGALT